MKKTTKIWMLAGAVAMSTASFAQLQDEKNVTITMDLQPVLQLKMEGPDQLDFTFDEISEYYAGIVKYGTTVLKVSASVSFDLWAVGLSQGQNAALTWDNPVDYNVSGAFAIDDIPLTALELHQFPANPAIAAGCANLVAASSDYSTAFAPATAAGIALGNNLIFCRTTATPYTAPGSDNTVLNSEKYIAGGTGAVANCSVAGGSYLQQTALGTSSYYYVLDYRILPGLPVTFPMHYSTAAQHAAQQTANSTADSNEAADAATALGNDATPTLYAAPGVYTMFVKYILAQDQ